MILNVDKLTKSYGVRTLFADASFRINERDRVALVGPNGAGKTTMMNIISGQDSADSGQVVFSKGTYTVKVRAFGKTAAGKIAWGAKSKAKKVAVK